MGDLNRASLMGRLGRDPEIRTTQTGEKVANFSIATSEQWKDKNTGEKKERTEWHNIVVWGPLAKVAEQYLRKGARVLVEGAIRTRKWQDQSGADRWSTEIVLSGFGANLAVIDWPDGDGRAKGQEDAYNRDSMPPGPGEQAQGEYAGGQVLDDEIPFMYEWRG